MSDKKNFNGEFFLWIFATSVTNWRYIKLQPQRWTPGRGLNRSHLWEAAGKLVTKHLLTPTTVSTRIWTSHGKRAKVERLKRKARLKFLLNMFFFFFCKSANQAAEGLHYRNISLYPHKSMELRLLNLRQFSSLSVLDKKHFKHKFKHILVFNTVTNSLACFNARATRTTGELWVVVIIFV